MLMNAIAGCIFPRGTLWTIADSLYERYSLRPTEVPHRRRSQGVGAFFSVIPYDMTIVLIRNLGSTATGSGYVRSLLALDCTS